MADYWLGVLTTPALVAVGVAAFALWVRAAMTLRRRGVTFEVKGKRHPERVSDYTLRHDIWWERQFGPLFIGGWYREPPRYQEPRHRLINRWLGVGSPSGPAWIVFHSRDLGTVPESECLSGTSAGTAADGVTTPSQWDDPDPDDPPATPDEDPMWGRVAPAPEGHRR